MAKDETNQLNLTVVALVALVAIVGLVALVMNAAAISKTTQWATGSQLAAAEESVPVYDGEGNLIGQGYSTRGIQYAVYESYDSWGTSGASCGAEDKACGGSMTRKCCDGLRCIQGSCTNA
jgi:hypothetical protein